MASLFATTSASGKNVCGGHPARKTSAQADPASTGKIH